MSKQAKKEAGANAPTRGAEEPMIAEDDLWDADQACAFFGGRGTPINRATLYRGVKEGRYPRPIHPSPGISRWIPAECREARRQQIQARDGKAAA